MSDVEIAWLAGLFEGEATFGYAGTRSGSNAKQVRITIAMTDKDVIAKAADIVGSGSFNPNKPKYSKQFPNSKPLWVFTVGGQGDCLELLTRLLPHMGQRRGARMRELIAHLEANPLKRFRGEGNRHGTWRRARSGCVCDACSTKRASMLEHQRSYDRNRRTK